MAEQIKVRALARGYHKSLIEEGETFSVSEDQLAAWMERLDGKPNEHHTPEKLDAVLGRHKARAFARRLEAAKAKADEPGDDKPAGGKKGKGKGKAGAKADDEADEPGDDKPAGDDSEASQGTGDKSVI